MEYGTRQEKYKNIIKKSNKARKKKKRLRLWVWLLLLLISSVAFIISSGKIINWYKDNKSTKSQLEDINKDVKVKTVKDEEKEEVVNPPQNKDSDYWNFIKMPLISVDFNELKKRNSDTVAFLKVNGTNINYPVVQTSNNDYYLNHSFNKSKNEAGWVFMDYRNDVNNLSDNTIIYAHGRVDLTMFGSLNNVLKKSWFDKANNHILYLSTPTNNTMWQVFSVYKIPTETYYLTSGFGSDKSHQQFIDTILKRSKFNFNAQVNTSDKIITLSTCYNKNDKLVLHAKLIKIQQR